ncbi:hypothetical protein QAD02_006636 [Eretmocerus hayati]|uniref:Uncharacterized protein n=1 Tax=Eretmocerus hayati TaxID=131215 RepID=A0ACC2N1E8_9HYME|nr:hypothetical protein QAD02_006636 [Eretmocerus hayati]
MSCNTCQAKFSFFTRENGCPYCGFSYCSKCLKYKYILPNVGEKKICGRCFNKLKTSETKSDMQTEPDDIAIPESLDKPLEPIDIWKRLESLANPPRPPITMYRRRSRLDDLGAGLDPIDQELVNRLKKLKNEDVQLPPPTEEDIVRRLALLKDRDPNAIPKPMDINQVDTRTPQQKSDDLIQEYLERLEISKNDEKTNDDIRKRLDVLRGIDSSKYSQEPMMDYEEDEASATKRIIEKALAEAALENKLGEIDDLEEFDLQPTAVDRSEDDLESCVMCDQTSDLVSCSGCTGDLYCSKCFRENHDACELHKHRTRPFRQRKMSD